MIFVTRPAARVGIPAGQASSPAAPRLWAAVAGAGRRRAPRARAPAASLLLGYSAAAAPRALLLPSTLLLLPPPAFDRPAYLRSATALRPFSYTHPTAPTTLRVAVFDAAP